LSKPDDDVTPVARVGASFGRIAPDFPNALVFIRQLPDIGNEVGFLEAQQLRQLPAAAVGIASYAKLRDQFARGARSPFAQFHLLGFNPL
jgi:hypothetical protein